MKSKILLMLLIAFSAGLEPPIVDLSCGPAEGSWLVYPDGTRIASWTGIPFGAPPVRWHPPQPATCWNGTLDATSYKDDCVQSSGEGSEDCLYLNVWVPAATAVPPPTLVYIYGGGLTDGSAQTNLTNFMRDVGHELGGAFCTVTMSYRLNVFGFLATAELSGEQGGVSGNYGIMDQQLALRWVQDEIARFGCDPKRITVAGQSSGGTSIFALMSSPASRGLFHAAISLSGSPNITIDMASAELQNAGIFAAAGCAQETPAERLACMRAAPVSTLVSAMPNSWNTPGLWGLPMGPAGQHYAGIVIVDGRTVTMPLLDAIAAGLVDVPFIFGNMQFEDDKHPDHRVNRYSQAQWQAFLNATFAAWGADAVTGVTDIYAAESAVDPQKAYDSISTDAGLTQASIAIARAGKSGGGNYTSPLYVYVNAWSPATPIPTDDPNYFVRYAFHTWDMTAGFDTFWADENYVPLPSDVKHGALLRRAWYALIANQTLDGSGLGWTSIEQAKGWPEHWGTFVMRNPDVAPFVGPTIVPDYKSDAVALYAELGIDQRFWWCD
eukprot:TRINITY_DN4443_c0_g1_i2.p1 TRINITY_DN4443_c0_g1~~TRINITY_DN4443_c0_g1_i2.p1  ORF type:complete len:552 (+),score=189.51 TRINITY_DN4443_c0_g1_i2:137-1792(+)